MLRFRYAASGKRDKSSILSLSYCVNTQTDLLFADGELVVDFAFDARGYPESLKESENRKVTGIPTNAALVQRTSPTSLTGGTRSIARPRGWIFAIPLTTHTSFGIVDGLNWLTRRWPRSRAMLDILVAALALFLVVWPVFKPNFEAITTGEVPFEFADYPVDDYSRSMLHPVVRATVLDLPENAITFTDWELLYPYYYVAHIGQQRTDLMFIETYPRDDVDGLAGSIVDFVIARQGERPIFVSERFPELADAGYDFTPARIGPTLMLRVYHIEDD